MQRLKRVLSRLVIVALILSLIPALPVFAGQITARSLTISTSQGNTAATWSFAFTVPSTTVLKSVRFEVCTTAALTCTVPTGWVNTGSTLSSTTGIGAGWTIDLATNSDSLGITNASNSTSSSGATTVVFHTVTNPNTVNTSWYVRMTTYSTSTYSTQVDAGTVTASTTQQISLTGIMPESLVFCTGTTITGTDCSTITGSTVNFGLFSAISTASGSSVMAASTNAGSGYVITVNGNTLQSGANSITQMSSSTTSVIGTSQFGMNLKANTIPSVGAEVTGPGSSASTAGYNTVNNFKYTTADTVANSGGAASDANTFTVSYIVNVPGNQAAGTYTTTLTYICTATF
ncbi:MAG: hypothetical protein ACHQUB_02620 [Candidatus Saccharimonadia bacterium]